MRYDLESTVLFQDLGRGHLDAIARLCTVESFSDGDLLIQESEPGPFDLYILRVGVVEIVAKASTFLSAEAVPSRDRKELFGEVSWLTKNKRSASVRCRGAVEVIRIDGDKLDAYMSEHPDVGFTIMRAVAVLLANRLRETDSLLKQLLWSAGV
jgi:CRP-like cAMP-binding protein